MAEPVPLRDVEIAQRLAGERRRLPLRDLLAAFDEAEATPEARARVAAALRMAGARARPAVADARPGARVSLSPAAGGRDLRPAIALAAVALLAGGATAAALVAGDDGGGGRPRAAARATTATTTAPATTTATATLPATTTATATLPATTTATTSTTTPAGSPHPAAARERRARARRRAAAMRRRERAVTVRLRAGPQASYLCFDHGPGTPAHEVTLRHAWTLKGRRVRINVGLSSVRATVNGKQLRLSGSPSGYDITARRRAYLPRGSRPCA